MSTTYWRPTYAELAAVTGLASGDWGLVFADGGGIGVYRYSGSAWVGMAQMNPVPNEYVRDQHWQIKGYSTAADRYTIQTPNYMTVNINNLRYQLQAQANLDLSQTATWDSVSTDYRVAATRAGVNFFIYACVPTSGLSPTILVSANSTAPSGYTTSNSRKVGGFHCLCAAVGTIASHTLTDFAQGDILPQSIWDLNFKPACSDPRGMVYSVKANCWFDIYLPSGTGTSTLSANGGTITDTR